MTAVPCILWTWAGEISKQLKTLGQGKTLWWSEAMALFSEVGVRAKGKMDAPKAWLSHLHSFRRKQTQPFTAKLILEWEDQNRWQSHGDHMANSLWDFGQIIPPYLGMDFSSSRTPRIFLVTPSQPRGKDRERGTYIFKVVNLPLIQHSCQLSHCQVLRPTVAMVCGLRRHVAVIKCVYLNTKVRELSSWYSSRIESFAQCH
jgi:hypothetical protein